MKYRSMVQQVGKWLVVAALMGFGFAMAQSEPTLGEVYATAQSGKLDKAQAMIQQVLISHPNSAKAHFVRAELYSRQGDLGRAREELTTAEKLAPGLPFAKAQSVQALRSQLSAKAHPQAAMGPSQNYTIPSAPSSSFSWGLPLLLAGGVIFLGYFMFRKRAPEPYNQPSAYANGSGRNGPRVLACPVMEPGL